MIGTIWTVLAFPFRVLFRLMDGAGRAASVLLGFGLMVAGAALAAGPMFWVGVPLFGFGLVLAMRALG
jgi:hypothetical protein